MMRAQNIVGKTASCDGIMRGGLQVGLTVILFIALLGLVSTPALAHGHGWYGNRACSKTASAAFLACRNEVKDDYWIAKGNCFNLSEAEDRAECFVEAKDEYEDAKEECRDQLEARKEVCEELGEAPYDPEIDPDDFVNPAQIGTTVPPNPYFPLVPGHMWTYKTTEDGGPVTETNTVEVMAGETVVIEGVTCVVVHDVVYDGNSTDEEDIIEETFDWYAQDSERNVWYFGERSLEREDCNNEDVDCDAYLLRDEGSWIAGLDGALPGIIMFGDLSDKVETVFRQEFALGDAEDMGEVESLTASPHQDVTNPLFQCNDQCLKTNDFTPIEPDVLEHKYYKAGVGVVLEENPEAPERVELVSTNFTP